MKTLSIDTSQHGKIIVGLTNDSESEVRYSEDFDFHKSQGLLPLLQKLLNDTKTTFSELDAITVNTGPGSFTGLRVGVSVANTLGVVLQIPINTNPVGQTVEPVYE